MVTINMYARSLYKKAGDLMDEMMESDDDQRVNEIIDELEEIQDEIDEIEEEEERFNEEDEDGEE